MNKQLKELINELSNLKQVILDSNLPDDPFDSKYGWNQIHINKNDLSNVLFNFINKLENYGPNPLTKGLESTIDSHILNIQRLTANTKSHLIANQAQLIHMVPSILLTVFSIQNDVVHELFSYDNIENKKLLPRSMSTRLRNRKNQIDSLEEKSENLDLKINAINDAYEAAENLPTDLANLKEARKELETIIVDSKNELKQTLRSIEEIKSRAISFESKAGNALEKTILLKDKTKELSAEAQILVEQCDDALQITTTEGLAAGFDQKAKELKNSIWVWIFGLLVALSSGAIMGSHRVEAFTDALNNELSAGQAILHAIISIFSIGGPLWLAWISTQQINQRFKLSEDYSYKATVAKSFTGFSKLAGRFDPSTEERLFNSTLDRLEEMPLRLIEGKDYNSPWHEFMDSESFKKAIDVVPGLFTEAGRFANKTKLKHTMAQTKQNKRNEQFEDDKN